MNKFVSRYALLIIGILLDLIVNPLLPSNFGFQGFNIQVMFGLIGLFLVTRSMDLGKKMMVASVYGFIIELQLYDSNLIFLLSVLLIVLISHYTWPIIGSSPLEKGIHLFILCSSFLFVSFLFARFIKMISASFINFITYQFILTMLLCIVLIMIMLIIETRLFDIRTQKERIRKRREHISMLD